jgi:hypothetical protein
VRQHDHPPRKLGAVPVVAPPSGATEEPSEAAESPLEQPPIKPKRAEPAEPVDPERAEPERVEPERIAPERVEPERVKPRDPDRQGAQEGTEWPWWRRMFGG